MRAGHARSLAGGDGRIGAGFCHVGAADGNRYAHHDGDQHAVAHEHALTYGNPAADNYPKPHSDADA